MTCIVGYITSDKVYMGGDSALSGNSQWTNAEQKVFKLGKFLIGFTGSLRYMQLIKNKLTLPEKPEEMDIEHYVKTSFIDAVRECLKDGGHAYKHNEGEYASSVMLLAYENRLFCIQSDFGVRESAHGYDAVGSGEEKALGALYALKHNHEDKPKRILDIALSAAALHDCYVREPFYFLHT